jgi:uncharacterized membrane protein (Fun14 family)
MAKESTSPSIGDSFGLNRYQFTPAKIMLLVAAIAMIGIGLFGSTGSSSTSQSTSPSSPQSAASRSLAPNGGNSLIQPLVEVFPSSPSSSTSQTSTAAIEDRTMLEQWSPSMVRGGFSMFIGFAIGYAIRAFLRLAIIIVGAFFIVLTLMAWAGWVEIHWTVIEGQFNHMISNLETQFASFKAFLMGSIPSAGLGTAGLASGLRQK